MEQCDKAKELTFPQAERYGRVLEDKIYQVVKLIETTDDFYKITEKHFRKHYNAEAEDEVVILPKSEKVNAAPMEILGYMQDLLLEREKLEKAMTEAKAAEICIIERLL